MPPQFGTKIDSRDNKTYRTVLMPDGNWWYAESYAWAGTGSSVLGNPANDLIYGRHYGSSFDVTPGTHIPTHAEFQAMLDSLGLATLAERSNALRSADYWDSLETQEPGSDLFGFALRGSGHSINQSIGVVAWLRCTDLKFYQASRGDDYDPPEIAPHLSGESAAVRLIVDEGNIPGRIYPTLYDAEFVGFERDASVRIERNIRWVDSVGGGVQGIPTMGASLDTWQISASFRVSQAQGAALEAAVGPYIGQVAPSLVLPHRMGENSFPGLVPSTIAESGDIYVNPCIQGAGFRSNGRVAVVTDLFDYGLDYDLTACPTGGDANGATTPITTAPAWLAGKFAQHSITDTSNERRAIKSDGYFNPLLYSAKHGRRFDYTIHLDLLSQAQADELVAYFRGVRHEAYTVTLEFGTEGFASKAAHFRELSFQRNGIHWDGELQITLARS